MMGGVYLMTYLERLFKESRVWAQFRFGVKVAEGGTHLYGAKYAVKIQEEKAFKKRWREQDFNKQTAAKVEEVYDTFVDGQWVKVTRYASDATGVLPAPRKRRKKSKSKGKYRRF